MRNRIISLILTGVLLISILPTLSIRAGAESITSGKCGESISWALDNNGILTLSGAGSMYDYGQFSEDWQGNHTYSLQDQPWQQNRSEIKSVIVEDGITYIGETAFSDCHNLTSITLPDSLICIGNAAFANCTSLKELSLPDSIVTIGMLAFSSCHNITSIAIPFGIKHIEDGAFNACSALKYVTYSGSEKDWNNIEIGDNNWQVINADISYEKNVLVDTSILGSGECGDNVTWILTSDGVLTISGYGAMEGWGNYRNVPWHPYVNQISAANIKNGVTTVGTCSFAGCEYLESVSIPDTVTNLYDGAFSVCKRLTTVTIPEGVTKIGANAFSGCESLTSIHIPGTVTSISFEAFDGCESLEDVYFSGSDTDWASIKVYSDNDPLFKAELHTASSTAGTNPTNTGNQLANDAEKRLIQINITYADGSTGKTEFKYSESGLLTATTMVTPYSSQESTFSYDAANRLTSIQVNSDTWSTVGPKAEYVYDGNGMLTEFSEAEGSRITTYYEYDGMGHCIKSTSEGEGMSFSSTYTYNSDSTQIDEELKKTDYAGNVTTDYISYFFSDAGKIIRKTCSGSFESYDWNYTYNYYPFVSVSEGNNTPFRIYLPDTMGHPIWEIEYIAIATMQSDSEGYLNRIITDYGDVYDFQYEDMAPPSFSGNDTDPVTENNNTGDFVLEVYSVDRNLSVKPGQELQLICALYHNDELVQDWNGVTWSIAESQSADDIIDVSNHEKIDVGYRLYVKGLKEGSTKLNISELTTGATISLDINVGNQYAVPIGCSSENVPSITLNQIGDFGTQVNFYNSNGLYVSDYSCEYDRKSDNYLVEFNVYNRSYMYGSVDIYNKDGSWIGSKKISKHENVRGVVDTLYRGTVALTEWCTGKSFSYKASTYSTETKVEIEVPSGGYFVISNNMSHSPGAYLYNTIDYFLQIISAANDLAFESVDVDAIQELTIEKMVDSDAFLLSYHQAIMDMTINISGDTLEKGYVDTVSSIMDGMIPLVGNALTESISATLGIAEDMVTEIIPPQFSIWLDALFGISTVSDSLGQAIDMCRSTDKSYIIIYTPEASGQLTVEGVQVTPEHGSLPENAMLQVSRRPNNDTLSVKKYGVATEEYQLYDIGFTYEGKEAQLNGQATIQLPIPSSYGWSDYAVLHQQEDGTWELADSEVTDNSIIVTVDHFSLFAVVDGSTIQKTGGIWKTIFLVFAVFAVVGIFIVVSVIRRKRRTRKKKGGRFLSTR